VSDTKHTPGPWRLAPAAAYAGADLNIDVGPSGQETYICCAGIRGDKEAEANARLIVAAPDLLAALIRIRDHGGSFTARGLKVFCEDTIAIAEGRALSTSNHTEPK
jgi:hypothetical protein